MVLPNDSVKRGQPVARVGNSGHTSEPHLHIHAISGTDTSKIMNGNGIPICFDNKFLIRNDRIKKYKF
ncbi:MAG: M23 family metallopeptidase [Flavobacteriales bacterium]|nr:M23 family metallopeptidase [Flavobacteriales bacterium]